jgi:hypothetical protein
MFNIFHLQENANQNSFEILPYPSQNGYLKKKKTDKNAGKRKKNLYWWLYVN